MICKTCHSPLIDFMSRAKCPICDRKEIEEASKKEVKSQSKSFISCLMDYSIGGFEIVIACFFLLASIAFILGTIVESKWMKQEAVKVGAGRLEKDQWTGKETFHWVVGTNLIQKN